MSINIMEIAIDKFLDGIIVLEDKHIPVFKLAELEISPEDKETIKKAIALRNQVNEDRGVTQFNQYHREAEAKVDEKGLTAEVMFSKVMKSMYENLREENWEIETPPIAEEVLDKSKQDFVIKNEEIYVTFDVKGQFNSAQSLNLNMRSFDRMKEQSSFFIAGIVDCKDNDFDKANKITFYYVENEYYEKESKAVLYSRKPNFTPFRSLPLQLVHQNTH